MASISEQIKVTSIESLFENRGVIARLATGAANAQTTAGVASLAHRQGRFLKEFSKSSVDALHQETGSKGERTWSFRRTIDGIEHTASFSDADMVKSITMSEVRDHADHAAKAEKLGVKAGQNSITVGGKQYSVLMSLSIHVRSGDGDGWLIKTGMSVLAGEGIAAAIAGVATGLGIGAFWDVLLDINSALVTVLRTALWGAVRVTYAFVSSFIGEMIAGASLNAAYTTAAAASGEIITGGAFSALTGAALAYTLVGLLVMVLIFVIVDLVLHESYHNVFVFNLTDKVLSYEIPHTYEGEHDHRAAMQIRQRLPAVGPVGVDLGHWYNASSFLVRSNSQFRGIGYAMTLRLQEPEGSREVGSFTCMFDIPFSGDNSLDVRAGIPSDLKRYYEGKEGAQKTTEVSIQSGAYQAIVTYDFLSGKHRNRDTGTEEYGYNSLVVVRPITHNAA